MLKHVEHFHGSDLEKIEKFYGIKKEDITSFSANVNPLGISYKLRQTLASHIDAITSYPDREYTSLRKSIAHYVSTNYESILVGNGSTELISLLIQMIHPQNTLLIGPTYSEYEREVSLVGGRCSYYDLKECDNFKFHFEDFKNSLSSDIDLLIICNPNNPTSSALTVEEMGSILELCSTYHIFVMVDETYVEFAEDVSKISAVSLTETYKNLMILRGISKFFAAPGLRLGYAICGDHELLTRINEKKNPWTINSLAAIAGEIMFQDKEYIDSTKKLIATERLRICDRLSECPQIKIYPCNANFLLLKILSENITSRELFDAAIRQGLMIRDCSTFPFLNNKFIRFCFMLPEKNDQLLSVLFNTLTPQN